MSHVPGVGIILSIFLGIRISHEKKVKVKSSKGCNHYITAELP